MWTAFSTCSSTKYMYNKLYYSFLKLTVWTDSLIDYQMRIYMIFSGKKERKTERKKERHLRQWKNEKMRVASGDMYNRSKHFVFVKQ